MFVIGTAGHIDHGKSCLISRLTGIDPDRLPEEKERGMTIDLGFAYYDTSTGKRIGIVDVPGHERFVRNMISGAGGIDAVLMVVAADDGWMPQSQEHFQITQLLGVRYGIIVINKIDLAEKSWVDLVEEDIRAKVQGTFLERAAVVRVSAATGEGIERLKSEIEKLAELITEREDIGKPRLYIDRSFVLQGIGGVVTGTLKDGIFRLGQDVAVFPSRVRGRIRNIQSHNQQVAAAFPGQRTALSLTGVDKDYLVRGGVISLPTLVENYPSEIVIAANVKLLEDAPINISDRRKLLMILGTTEVEGEARLYDERELRPGEKGIVFFRPTEALLTFLGDRFIFRLPTPPVTVGGGVVIDLLSAFPTRKERHLFQYLSDLKELTADSLIGAGLKKSLFVSAGDFAFSAFAESQITEHLRQLYETGSLKMIGNRCYRPADYEKLSGNLFQIMEEFFTERPHIEGLTIDYLAKSAGLPTAIVEPVLQLLVDENRLVRKKNRFDLPGRQLSAKGEIKAKADTLEEIFRKGGTSPPTIEEAIRSEKSYAEAIEYLFATGKLVKIGGALAFHRDIWKEIISKLLALIADGRPMAVGEFREGINSSRKYVVPILEETDRLKITQRQGDFRIPGENYEKAQTLF